jgi:heme exporter protein A
LDNGWGTKASAFHFMTTSSATLPAALIDSRLCADQLSCVRGDRTLFADVGFELGAGEWLHVRGENGVGKTSLLRLLAGLSKPAAGNIEWNGTSIEVDSSSYHRALFFLGHRDALKDDLTALENLLTATALDGSSISRGQAFDALHRFGLRGRELLPINCLSAGQKRRVLLARLLLGRATLWILDEPFNALDGKAVKLLADLIAEHLAAGGIAVLTSHQAIPLPHGKALSL